MAKATSPEQLDQLVQDHMSRLKAVESLANEEKQKQLNRLQETLAKKRRRALESLQQAQEEQVSCVVYDIYGVVVNDLANKLCPNPLARPVRMVVSSPFIAHFLYIG